MNISDLLPKLIQKGINQRNGAILFHFTFEKLEVKGIFFARSKNLTIGIQGENVGWQIEVASGQLSELIPNEAYQQIFQVLKSKEGKYSNRDFFLKLHAVLADLSTSPQLDSPTDDDIKELIGTCRTNDKKHDSEGDKPFFDHWRRVSPSADSLKKIGRHFGAEVKITCHANMVTAVWSSEYKGDSLLFLNPQNAIKEVLKAPSPK